VRNRRYNTGKRGGVLPRRGLSLVELLVVVAILAVLMSILLPALTAARGRMKTVKCACNLRTAGFDFQLFAEGQTSQGRGDSDTLLGKNRFRIEDFQDRLYRIDEFWQDPAVAAVTLEPSRDIMLCPAGRGPVTRYPNYPCGPSAIQPLDGVTIAANMRLYRAVTIFMGRPMLAPAASTAVRTDILHHPYVPLLMDVDAVEAVRAGREPFYIAPPLPGEISPYADGRSWIPGRRHGRMVNVVFVGGHVLASRAPEREPWDWAYQGETSKALAP
jgi:prepilin-type N-terminal cleavage/methylation domain-containing protein/prepilin-type processing-associated H-X9-DG protein